MTTEYKKSDLRSAHREKRDRQTSIRYIYIYTYTINLLSWYASYKTIRKDATECKYIITQFYNVTDRATFHGTGDISSASSLRIIRHLEKNSDIMTKTELK